jgi:hypothetical protein
MAEKMKPRHLAPLCKDVAAIRITTVSPKAIEQLGWIHDKDYNKFDWQGKEIIGKLTLGGLLVRDTATNNLFRVSELVFISRRAEDMEGKMRAQGVILGGTSRKKAIDQAQAELAKFPQVFTI